MSIRKTILYKPGRAQFMFMFMFNVAVAVVAAVVAVAVEDICLLQLTLSLIGSRSPSFSAYAYMVVCSSDAALLLFRCCYGSAVPLLMTRMTRMTTAATTTCISRHEQTRDSHVVV